MHRNVGPMLAADQTAALIENAVEKGTPFCFVRLGDGEGNLLNFTTPAAVEDLEYFKGHFGNGVTGKEILKIKNNLIQTIEAADLVGVRDDVWLAPDRAMALDENDADFLTQFRATFPLRDVECEIDRHAAKRIFRLYKWTRDKWSRAKLATVAAVCSSWVCYDLAVLGFWERLIVASGSIGLIHCSPTLPERIEAELGVEVESILVPDKSIARAQWADRAPDLARLEHYPDQFARAHERLNRPLNGKTFLIGAGLVGKKYLQIIKDNGGIAFDVGALLDAWDGRCTRPLVYRDKLEGWIPSEVSPSVYQLAKDRVGGP
jgi:hypothetical protein